MDLHEFSGGEMYFDEKLNEQVLFYLEEAAAAYGEGDSERLLMKALALEPESLTVQVALYRFYYYQHRHHDALCIAKESMRIAARRLDLNVDWENWNLNVLGLGVMKSMTLVRFYLLALKGAGYLNLRLGNMVEGAAMLNKVASLDSHDRLGSSALLDVVERYRQRFGVDFGRTDLIAS